MQEEDEEAGQPSSRSTSEVEDKCEVSRSPQTSAWVVTRPASKRKAGCLHVIGRCYRVLGVHYNNWVEVADGVDQSAFSNACRQCFPMGYPVIEDAHLETVEASVDVGMLNEAPEEGQSSSEE